MNLATMRTNVRRDLHDEDSGSYRWSDDELDRHIAHALADFSRALPVETSDDIASTPGSREIDISSLTGRVTVHAVEYPIGQYPPLYRRFALWQDTLTILSDTAPDGSDVRVYWGKMHTLDAESSTIPSQHENLVALGAEGNALLEWANYAINRVNIGGTQAAGAYRQQGIERLSQFRRDLKRIGRKSKVRSRQLYTPSTGVVSESTVAGP